MRGHFRARVFIRRTVAGAALAGLLVVPLVASTEASAAVPVNTHFALGHGEHPDIAVGADGTAYVAWVHRSSPGKDDQIQFCRVPRGKRACVGLTTFHLAGEQIGERPYVFLPGGSQVWVLSYRCCFTPAEFFLIDKTVILRSSNGGKTFAAPQVVGAHSAMGDAQLGPHGTVYTIGDVETGGVTVQRGNLNGTGVSSARARLGADEYGGSLAVLPNGSVLASHWDFHGAGPSTLHVSRFSGVGDANASASWKTVFTAAATKSPTTGGKYTELASGKKGVFLFSQDNEVFGRFQVRKWNGATFGKPGFITPAGQDNIFPSFWEDAAGRTSVAYSSQNRLVTYRSSDRKGFAAPMALKAANAYNLRGATASDGGGFVAYDANDGAGLVSLVPIPAHRVITESVKGATMTGRVVAFRAGQPVVLQQATKKGWVTVATKRLSAKGTYAFSLAHRLVKYRAVALATEGYGEADGAAVLRR